MHPQHMHPLAGSLTEHIYSVGMHTTGGLAQTIEAALQALHHPQVSQWVNVLSRCPFRNQALPWQMGVWSQ